MQVRKVVETEDGAVEFEGKFSPEEVGFMLNYALTSLIQKGIVALDMEKRMLVTGNDTEH